MIIPHYNISSSTLFPAEFEMSVQHLFPAECEMSVQHLISTLLNINLTNIAVKPFLYTAKLDVTVSKWYIHYCSYFSNNERMTRGESLELESKERTSNIRW